MKVLIVMSSENDAGVMEEAHHWLNWFGVENEMIVASVHRTPEKVRELITGAKEQGYGVVIAGSGMAAALPGLCAAYTTLPVIGVPLEGGLADANDALYSMVQMPAGIPVATMGIGKNGARNAAVMAARIIAIADNAIAERLEEFKENEYEL